MTQINDNFLKLQKSYLFVTIAKKVAAFKEANPQAKIIRLGIGDVTRPLAPAVINAMHHAVDELANADTFRGYGPEHGYDFLQDAIIANDFKPRGISLEREEVFVNDGAKSDTGNIGDILGLKNSIGVTDPIYPVYIDSNVMNGRAGEFINGLWSNIIYMPCTAENNFVAQIPDKKIDIIYLCYPNNPTGTVITREQLQKWVEYALRNKSLIMYDAAYEAYIQDPDIPHSIYEIEGAKKCAIEFHSYSKTAGFTGVRCGYTIVPKELTAFNAEGDEIALNPLWERRQSTKFNGASYITQRGAEAIYSPEGKKQVKETIDYYMTNARIMRETLLQTGLTIFGGENAPYIWVKTPKEFGSWEMFDHLLNNLHLVCTPGVGFGPSGEGYVRLTTFGNREDCIEAMERLKKGL
ncbi:MAG: LL-diaminopimelate aminotransferase [Prevotellaceae bacterium]|nr:LL-diaminopimelate aminotransferase [Prevotellaceae bacterium]